jgi:hypothetical protein
MGMGLEIGFIGIDPLIGGKGGLKGAGKRDGAIP